MNVVWLFEYPTLLGGERSLLACLLAIRRAGFEVAAVAPSEGPLADELKQQDVLVHPPLYGRDAGQRRDLAELRRDLSDLLRRYPCDLLHANSLSTARIAGPVAADSGVASIGHLRDIVNLSAAAIADLNGHTRLLAVSEATRKHHVAAELDEAKMHVLYNGVDLERFRPRESSGWLHNELGIAAGTPIIGAIGQIGLRKGFDVLLAAAVDVSRTDWQSVLREEGMDCQSVLPGLDPHFVIIGERHSEKEESVSFERDLHSVATNPPLAGRVHFLGVRDDVAELLPELALLVHSARQEPLGRVLLEGAACGLPIIATDVGGTREIFPQEEEAMIVPPDDPSALAEAMTHLLNDEPRRNTLGRAARSRVEAAFDLRTAAENLVAHYRCITASM